MWLPNLWDITNSLDFKPMKLSLFYLWDLRYNLRKCV
jgi:hypothetical protein